MWYTERDDNSFVVRLHICGRVFELTGDEAITMGRDLEAFGRATNTKKRENDARA